MRKVDLFHCSSCSHSLSTKSKALLQATPPTQRVVLANQLVLLVSEDHSLPFVERFNPDRFSARRDPPGKEGLADLTRPRLLWGTSKRDLNAIYQELDSWSFSHVFFESGLFHR